MLLTSALIALALSGVNAFQNRNGRTGELRVFNFIDSHVVASPAVAPTLSDGMTVFTSGNVRVNAVFGSQQEQVFNNVAPTTSQQIDNFVHVDVEGSSNTLNVTLTQNGLDTSNHQVCQGSNSNMQANVRNTLVITSFVNGADVAQPTCSTQGGECNVGANSANSVGGTVGFLCDMFNEVLENDPACETDRVSIFRADPLTCDQHIFRTSTSGIVGLGAGEEVRVADPLKASPTLADPDIRNLDNTQVFEIIVTEVFTDAGLARRHELFWGPGFFDTDSLKTGFVKVINGNFRTNQAGTSLDNTYDFTIGSQNDQDNFHFQLNLAPEAQSPSATNEWIELPLGSALTQTFRITLYTDESATTLFGVKSTQTLPTATPITFDTFSLAANEYAVIVIHGGQSANTQNPSIDKVTVENPASGLVDEFQTGHELFNFINGGTSLKFATPDTSCCNFVNFNEGDVLGFGSGNSRTIQSDGLPLTTDNSLNAYFGGAVCGALASSLIQQDVVTLDASLTGCSRKAHFFLGRQVTLTGQQVSSDQGSCNVNDCSNTVTIVGGVNQVNAQTNDIRVLTVEVPKQCKCADITPVVPNCDVCLIDEFAALSASVTAVRSTVTAVENSLASDIDNVDNDLRKTTKTINDIEKDVLDVDSKLDEVESNQDDIEDEVKAVRRINNNILKEVRE